MPQRKTEKPRTLTLFLLICATALVSGCGILSTNSKVVFVPESNGMIRIGKDVEGHVYTFQEGEWIRTPNIVRMPEGWYAGSLDTEDGSE